MDYVTLGRTGLTVSVAGLGCGGISRLGLNTGKTEADAVRLLRRAVDLGVNFFDTAAEYGTEVMLGFHMMHQNARRAVLPHTRTCRVGTLAMLAVRNTFAKQEQVAKTLRELATSGDLPQALADMPEPLGFLIHAGGASSLTDAA